MDFKITSKSAVSMAFRQKGISSFQEACNFIKTLPYHRNHNKNDILAVLKDGFGTCSTKHAILWQLAADNNQPGYRLMLGIFKMNADNTPRIADVLKKHNLPYIPEAHNYLRINSDIVDCTGSTAINFQPYLLQEISIAPGQITDFKVRYHKDYLEGWAQPGTAYTLSELWMIREACIAALSG